MDGWDSSAFVDPGVPDRPQVTPITGPLGDRGSGIDDRGGSRSGCSCLIGAISVSQTDARRLGDIIHYRLLFRGRKLVRWRCTGSLAILPLNVRNAVLRPLSGNRPHFQLADNMFRNLVHCCCHTALFSGTQECHRTNTALRLGRSAAAATLCSAGYPVCQDLGTI